MKRTTKRLFALTGLGGAVALSMAFVTFSGNPRWPLSGGFHYVVDLNPTSFPAGPWELQARKALSDSCNPAHG